MPWQPVAGSCSCWRGDNRSAQHSNASSTVTPLFGGAPQQLARCPVAMPLPAQLLLLQGLPPRTVACREHAGLQFTFSKNSIDLQKRVPLAFLHDSRTDVLSCVPESPVSSEQGPWWQTDPAEHHTFAHDREVGGSESSWSGSIGTATKDGKSAPGLASSCVTKSNILPIFPS